MYLEKVISTLFFFLFFSILLLRLYAVSRWQHFLLEKLLQHVSSNESEKRSFFLLFFSPATILLIYKRTRKFFFENVVKKCTTCIFPFSFFGIGTLVQKIGSYRDVEEGKIFLTRISVHGVLFLYIN